MKKLACLTIVTALVSILPLPVSAATQREAEGTFCGGNWTSKERCDLRYAGDGLTVSISLFGLPAAAGVVRLEAIEPTTGKRVILLECEAGGQAGGCNTTSTEPVFPLAQDQQLFCVVKGIAAEGTYACSTGT